VINKIQKAMSIPVLLALDPLDIEIAYKKFKRVLIFYLTGLVMTLPQIAFAQGAGRALTFDGSAEYVRLDYGTTLDLLSSFTLEGWAKVTSVDTITPKKQVIYCRKSPTGGGKGYGFAIVGDEVKVGINQLSSGTDGVNLAVDTWYHIAGTYNEVLKEVKIYVNGVLRTTATANQTPVGQGAHIATLGKACESDVDYLGGTLDEVRIWSGTRTQTEIQDNMCKKLAGTESGLVGYWRLDESSDTLCADSSPNINDGGTRYMDEANRVWSGAALGDASAYAYSSEFNVNLVHSDGDDITAARTAGTPDGAQVYRVDAAPNVTTVPASSGWDKLDPLRYWGVFVVGSATYTVTYNYDGHPGIATETNLRLAKRDNGASTAWTDAGVTPDTDLNTLTKTGESGTEYILGSASDNSLPVELSYFGCVQRADEVHLTWITESEIENLGFIIERRSNDGEWKEIANYIDHQELSGQGSITSRTEYNYVDKNIEVGKYYEYRLADVSYQSIKDYHNIPAVGVFIEEILPTEFTLKQNYPNPFNPTTQLNYDLPEQANVTLIVYDMLGREVTALVNQTQKAGYKSVQWDATDQYGKSVSAGMYFYQIKANDYIQTRKMILLK